MKRLVISGWNVGLDKILLTKTLRSELDYSLSEAKSITDQVVANEEIGILLDRAPSAAEDLMKRVIEIGVKASIED